MANSHCQTGEMKGRDAMHRTRQKDTHPTHGCIKDFCGFDAMLIASWPNDVSDNPAILPFSEMANSISLGAPS